MAFIIGVLADLLGLGQALMILGLGLTMRAPLYLLKMEKTLKACSEIQMVLLFTHTS